MIKWDEKWPQLRGADVFPLPLASETNWTPSGWEVNVVLLTDVAARGFHGIPLWTHCEPYNTPGHAHSDEARAVTERALSEFGHRLREVLSPPRHAAPDLPAGGPGDSPEPPPRADRFL
ncbi:MAG: hypothetical protein WAV45_07485 [Propionibacteriaceae bacterium]